MADVSDLLVEEGGVVQGGEVPRPGFEIYIEVLDGKVESVEAPVAVAQVDVEFFERRFQFDEDEATRLREQLDAAEKELARRVAEAKARAGEKDAADAADKKVADLVASKGYLSKLRARRVVVAQQIAEMRRKAEMQKSTFLSARARGSIASDESTRTMGKVRSLERSLGVLDASIAAEERKK